MPSIIPEVSGWSWVIDFNPSAKSLRRLERGHISVATPIRFKSLIFGFCADYMGHNLSDAEFLFGREGCGGGHAATPERCKNSVCQTAKGTPPFVAFSISRAVSASGNLTPATYLLTVACFFLIISAKTACVTSSFERYAFKVSE